MSTFGYLRAHYRLYAGIGIALLIVAIALTKTLPADARVAIFDSFFVERQVEEKKDSVTNTIQDLHTHTWSSFAGEIPENVTINDISLVLTWSKTLDEDMVEAEIEVPFVNEENFSDEGAASSTDEDRELIEELSTTTSTEESEDPPETIIVEEEEIEESPEEIPVEPSENTEDTPVEVEIEESLEVEESPAAFLPEMLLNIFTFANLAVAEAYVEGEEDLSSESEAPISEVSETIVEISKDTSLLTEENEVNELSSTTSEVSETEVIEDETEATSSPLYPTLESASVQYSFDGDMWTNLGTINLIETNEATLTLSIDTFSSIQSLLVRIVYLAPQSAVPIVFGNAQLKLDYTPILVEEVIAGPSDQEPNFSVSSVKKDIINGNARAVLLERGGVLELWSGLTNSNGEVSVWKRLVSGSTLDENTAIDVHKDIVFWFELNGNALLAYDLKRESLIGGASASSLGNDFVLIFEEGRQSFIATYSPVTGVFQFEPVSP